MCTLKSLNDWWRALELALELFVFALQCLVKRLTEVFWMSLKTMNCEWWLMLNTVKGWEKLMFTTENYEIWIFLGSFWSCKNHNFKGKIPFIPCPPTDLPTFNLIAMSVLLLELCFHFIYSEVICNSKWVFFFFDSLKIWIADRSSSNNYFIQLRNGCSQMNHSSKVLWITTHNEWEWNKIENKKNT